MPSKIMLSHNVLLRRREVKTNYVVHGVFLSISSLSEKFDIGLLVIEGDRAWFEVVVKRRYRVGIYEESGTIRIVEDDSYVSDRAYDLLSSRYELHGLLVLRNPYGIVNSLRMIVSAGQLRYYIPSTRQLRYYPTTGTLRWNL